MNRFIHNSPLLMAPALFLACLGCGARSSYTPSQVPFSVMLTGSTVTLSRSGQSVIAPITIVAPTEAVTLVVQQLPVGVTYTYKATDTNPSGVIVFTAAKTSVAGTYHPAIAIAIPGQTASEVISMVIVN